eukprot:1888840-Amphidinium_carterae.1
MAFVVGSACSGARVGHEAVKANQWRNGCFEMDFGSIFCFPLWTTHLSVPCSTRASSHKL